MSLYCSALVFEDEAAPLTYVASHVMPSPDHAATTDTFELAEIPGYIEHDGQVLCPDAAACDGSCLYPYLRVSVNTETVVLTAEQVRKVHEYTGQWLQRLAEMPTFVKPDEPVADMITAFDASEKGTTDQFVEIVHITVAGPA